MVSVKVQRLPGDTRTVSVREGDTVADAIREAGFERQSGDKVRVNGVTVPDPEDFELSEDDTDLKILITGAIKGA